MPTLSSSPSARISLAYITGGALIQVWSWLWFLWLHRHPPASDGPWFVCYGLIFTGVVLLVIGLSLGAIGRAARPAEVLSHEITPVVAQPGQNLVVPAPVVAVNPAAPLVVPGG
jgi:hypothetical protein